MSGPSASIPRSRRLRRGTKTEDYLAALAGEHAGGARASTSASASVSENPSSKQAGPPPITSIETPFQVQEYLAMLVAENPHDIQRLVQIPRWRRASSDEQPSKDKGKQVQSDATSSASPSVHDDLDTAKQDHTTTADNTQDESENDEYEYVDRDVWLYEHLRRLAIDLSQPFVVTLQEHCSRETCPEMKAGEWLYLCAAHATANETECCAIDYITHTLDGATALLNSSRYFPSRINIPPTSLKHFSSIARRLYRIFAHAWYHHRELFDICESSTSLYERFLALSIEYDLVPRELLTIPSQHASLSENDPSNTDNAEAGHAEMTRESRSNTVFSRAGGGIRMNGLANKEDQDAKEEEEQNQIQRRILEKRVLKPSYTQSGGGKENSSSSANGMSNEEEDDEDDSSEESSDDEVVNMPQTSASMAGLSLNESTNGSGKGGNVEEERAGSTETGAA